MSVQENKNILTRTGVRKMRKDTKGHDRNAIGQDRAQPDIIVGGRSGWDGRRLYRQNRTEQNRTERNRTEQNRTEQNRTEQNRTEQNRTEQNRTEQNRTEQNRKEQRNRTNGQQDLYLPYRYICMLGNIFTKI